MCESTPVRVWQPASVGESVEGGREDAVDIDGMQNTPITESAIGVNPAQKCVEGAVISVVGGVGLMSFLGTDTVASIAIWPRRA
jgi:hypothetical protein